MSKSVSARASSVVLASACLGVFAPAPAHAIIATWDGGTLGNGSVWSSPLNWVGDVLPADGDSILIATANVSASNPNGIVAGTTTTTTASTGREMYLNQSATGTGSGTPFTGTPPSKSFQSISFGTEDAGTTRLPAGLTVFNGINSTYTVSNVVRLTGDANGNVLNLGAGATGNSVALSNGSFGTTTYELAGATAAANGINVAAVGSRFTLNAIVGGANGLTKSGAGLTFLNNANNTIAGDFFVNAGTLGFSNGGAFGPSTNTVRVADNATLSLDNVNITGDTVAATHSFQLQGTGTRVFVGASEAWTLNGTVGGTGALVKTGTGALNLNGPLTYAGDTAVNAGSLYVNSTLNSGTRVVANPNSTLGGLGTINGNVAVGGTLLPGSSSTLGTLTVNGNLALNIDGEIIGGFRSNFSTVNNGKDALVVTGAFDITGSTLTLGSLNAQNEPVQVIATYGSLVGGAFNNVTGLVGGYSLVYNYNGLNQIALVRGNTKLFFTGSSGTDLLTDGNFTTDAAGTATATQSATASADVTFGTANVNTGNLATTIAATAYANSLTFTNPAATSISSAANTNNVNYVLNLKASALNNAAGVGIVVAPTSGPVTINTQVGLVASQSFTNNSTASPLTVAGPVLLGANTLTLAGPGTTSLSGIVSGTGGLTKSGPGRTLLSGANTYVGTTTVTGGVLEVLPAAASVILTGGTALPPVGQGADIQGGRIEFNYVDTASPLASIEALLTAGYAQPTKFATGLLRSTTAAAAGRTLGYKDDGSRITVRVTLPGDANLDGAVSFDDFVLLQGNFNQSNVTFGQGDFDYNDVVNFDDFVLLQGSFGQSIPGGRAAFGREEYAAVMSITDAGQVPEPASLAVLGLTAAGLLRRRCTV